MRTYSWPEGHWNWPIRVTHKHGVRCGQMIFLGGQVDLDGSGNVLHPGDLLAQIDKVMGHIETILVDLGASLSDLVKLQVFYVEAASLTDADVMARIARALPPSARIALTMIPIPFLSYGGMVAEIEGIAMLAEDGTSLPRRTTEPTGIASLPLPFVHGLQCGAMIFVSGQAPRDATDAMVAPHDIVTQSTHVMDRIAAVLQALGSDLHDVVKINRWYTGHGAREDWEPAALTVASRFAEPGPVATGIPLPRFPDPHQRTMIDVIAMPDAAGKRECVSPEGHWDWPVHLPHCHGVKCGNMVFIGGQVSLTPLGDVLHPNDIVEQTRIGLVYIREVLASFGLIMGSVVKVLALFSAIGRAEELHSNLSIRSAAFAEPGPPTTGIPVPHLTYPGMMMEIEVIAMAD
jgi:enamine deaminase RidA (YjgF/YER057c/UK114 family)